VSELQDLYQQVILDHNQRPRNFHPIEGKALKAEGHNPLCGDRLTLWVDRDGGRLKDVGFVGSGCAISKASASMMTADLKGKTVTEAEEAFERFRAMLTENGPDAELGKLGVFAGVREFPSRIKCATLAWHTVHAALAGKAEPVTTE
jgi:nitrogen fixation protein NifU and related proteins